MWQRDGRDIKIDDDLTISIKYTGDANAFKAVRLDNEIIPLIEVAPELLAFCVDILDSWRIITETSTIEPTERMIRLEKLVAKAEGR
jgi:hypothetical protein